jgi:hypothetical protein
VLKLKVGVCTHETLDNVLTEPVSPLGVDPTLHRPTMTGFEECPVPDMHIRFHALFVESPRFTILHITVEVVVTCRARNNPELLILKFHKRRSGKTSRHVRSGPLNVHLVSGPDNLE